MDIVPFVHEGLGNSSYLYGMEDGSALLVDPDRAVARYLSAAEARGWRIESVFETHVHADFVTGACEIAAATGATMFAPAGGGSRYPDRALSPGERVRLSGVEMEALGTPGHTPEHTGYVLRKANRPPALFSGGALIVNGAARTDLVSPDLTEELTRAQHRTLTTAFQRLPDETLLFPTHGGGSFCSAGDGTERTSTLGRERAQNPVLRYDDEEEFVRWFPSTFPAVPDYFSRMRAVNQAGPRLRNDIPMPPPLVPDEFAAAAREALIVDLRPHEQYVQAHIPGALLITFRDAYATWLGWLAPIETPLLFVRGDAPVEQAVDESLLVGFERFGGWLQGGVEAWSASGRPTAGAIVLDAAGARQAISEGVALIDVREPAEFAAGHIEGAAHIPLGRLARDAGLIPKDRPVLTYCALGERSATAVSVLERAGFADVLNLDGGLGAWESAGYRVAAS